MTTDHKRGMELCDQVIAGKIGRQQAREDLYRETLVSAMGIRELPYLECSPHPFKLQPGDRLLLCTDGVYGTVDDEHLAALCFEGDPQLCCERVIQAIVGANRPKQDNSTVILLRPHEFRRSNSSVIEPPAKKTGNASSV